MVDPLENGRPLGGPSVVIGSLALYGVIGGAGYLWLWLRDRSAEIPAAARGEYGLLASMAIGTAMGLGATGLFVVLIRYFRPLARLQSRLGRLIGPLSEGEITVIALSSSVGEEFFFRMAMQDALGLYVTAALFAVMHIGPKGFLLWTVVALLLGLVFGWMMELGCGLLSVTVAHALINYFSLRRMEFR